mmetsp:Transcript_88049/g.235568  ORF Transcript_88049/g.235568 Transcript_88049/m.235568 type:complete len:392 (-) Transcript_88049:2137-3312(-)
MVLALVQLAQPGLVPDSTEAVQHLRPVVVGPLRLPELLGLLLFAVVLLVVTVLQGGLVSLRPVFQRGTVLVTVALLLLRGDLESTLDEPKNVQAVARLNVGVRDELRPLAQWNALEIEIRGELVVVFIPADLPAAAARSLSHRTLAPGIHSKRVGVHVHWLILEHDLLLRLVCQVLLGPTLLRHSSAVDLLTLQLRVELVVLSGPRLDRQFRIFQRLALLLALRLAHLDVVVLGFNLPPLVLRVRPGIGHVEWYARDTKRLEPTNEGLLVLDGDLQARVIDRVLGDPHIKFRRLQHLEVHPSARVPAEIFVLLLGSFATLANLGICELMPRLQLLLRAGLLHPNLRRPVVEMAHTDVDDRVGGIQLLLEQIHPFLVAQVPQAQQGKMHSSR